MSAPKPGASSGLQCWAAYELPSIQTEPALASDSFLDIYSTRAIAQRGVAALHPHLTFSAWEYDSTTKSATAQAFMAEGAIPRWYVVVCFTIDETDA